LICSAEFVYFNYFKPKNNLDKKLVFLVDSNRLIMGLFSSSNETKCKKCGTVLSDHERLKKHQDVAHGKKKEKCRACGTEFDSLEDLRKHKKNCK